MGKRVDGLEGLKKNNFTVIGKTNLRNSSGSIMWECECFCGNIKYYTASTIRGKMPRSCGCVPRYEDMTGFKFNEFTVIRLSEKRNSDGILLWECQCSCGEIRYYLTTFIKQKKRQSCGCKQKKYGDLPRKYKVEHYTWESMKARCSNPNHPDYADYGGRGIKVCERWKQSFANFLEDMGPKMDDNLTIERVDNNGNYEPGNCIWADYKTQTLNRRKYKNNTSGVTGVRWEERQNKWIVRIWNNYKTINLGSFENFNDAVEIRRKAEIKYHGKHSL